MERTPKVALQKAPSGKLSLKEFHHVALQTGNVPLAVLDQVSDDSITAAR